MSIKSGWLKFSGTVDYFWSGFKEAPILTPWWSAFLGTIAGTAMIIGLDINDNAGVKSFSDDADRDVEMFEGGVVIAFPDNCDLGSGFYLISNKKGGGLEIGSGSHKYSRALSIEAQEKITDDISDCMDDMSGWVKKGRFNFAEEFHYQAGLDYSEAGIIFDRTDGNVRLYKDIIEEKSDKPLHMKAVVEALGSYAEDSDNSRLYKAEFAKAQQTWQSYKSERSSRDPYFTRDKALKDVGSYATYEYNSVGLKLWSGLVGGSALAVFLFNCGPNTRRRDGAYDQREEKRQEKIKDIQSLAKHKPLDF